MTATTTAADALLEARRYLQSGQRDERNLLAAPYTAGQAQLTFTYDLRGINQGATISIGLNTFYVWSVDQTSKTAQVTGGQDGSTDTDCDTGDIVLVRPRHTDSDLFKMLNDELSDLSSPASGLFQMRTSQFTPNGSFVGYDLTGAVNVQSIYEVRYVDSSGNALRDLPRLRPHEYRLERNDSVSASTYRIMLFNGGNPGYPVTVLYKAGFTPLATLSDLLVSSGLDAAATDLPPMGVALRAVVGREIRRNDTYSQGDTRRAEEVPAGAQQSSWRGIAAQRSARLQAESSRLQAAYPVLM